MRIMTSLGRFEWMWGITAAGWLAGLALYPWLTQIRVSSPTFILLGIVGVAVSPMVGAGVLSLIAQFQDDVLCNDQRRPDTFLLGALSASALAFLTVVGALAILAT
jgi:hypothetical protein